MNTFKEVKETSRYITSSKQSRVKNMTLEFVFTRDLLAPLLCYLFRQSSTGH